MKTKVKSIFILIQKSELIKFKENEFILKDKEIKPILLKLTNAYSLNYLFIK